MPVQGTTIYQIGDKFVHIVALDSEKVVGAASRYLHDELSCEDTVNKA
jgi:hypothetical protein